MIDATWREWFARLCCDLFGHRGVPTGYYKVTGIDWEDWRPFLKCKRCGLDLSRLN